MAWILTSVIFYAYSKLYILTKLSANDVKITSVDRQKLDLSKYIYLWYRKFYICRDTALFYEHKKWPSYYPKHNTDQIQYPRIRVVWSEPFLVTWIFYDCKATDWTAFGVSKLTKRLHRLVWVYTCQNSTFLEFTCSV